MERTGADQFSLPGFGSRANSPRVSMLMMGEARIFLAPIDFDVFGIDATNEAGRLLRFGAQEKELVAPQNGRAMSDSGQLDSPIEVFVGPTSGNCRRFLFAGAVGT